MGSGTTERTHTHTHTHIHHTHTRTHAQVVIVSATLPTEVLEITQKFMTDPIRVLVKRDELTLEVREGREGREWIGLLISYYFLPEEL